MKKGIITGLISIISFVVGIILGGKMLVGMINDYKMRMERNLSNMMLLNGWLEFIYSGGRIEQYFQSHGYKKVMIYGNGYTGKRLYQALEKTDIDVVAIMDKMNRSDAERILIGVDSKIPDIDCVIITPTFYYDEIYDMLRKRIKVPIISIEALWG